MDFRGAVLVMLLASRVAALRLGNCGSDVAISASQAFEGIVITPLLRRLARFIQQPNDAREGAAHPVLTESMHGTLRHRSGT